MSLLNASLLPLLLPTYRTCLPAYSPVPASRVSLSPSSSPVSCLTHAAVRGMFGLGLTGCSCGWHWTGVVTGS
ncbi:hypothetical protein BC567DRAFT_228192 [Phyllosticta citribraziliensis]